MNSGTAGAVTVSGDGTINPSTGALAVTKTGGVAFATVATSGSASNLTTGSLPHAQLPALVSTDIPNNAANTSGTAANITGVLTAGSSPAYTGDATKPAGSLATTVKAINGVALSGLATGLLAVTTTTGVPRAATAADVTAAVTSGTANEFIGTNAPANTGSANTFAGAYAGQNNTTGSSNTFAGTYAGYYSTTGSSNTFAGTYAGLNNTTGSSNTFAGQATGYYNTTGSSNTFAGQSAGQNNTTGNQNTFVGTEAGLNNTTGSYNTFAGTYAGLNNTTGSYNTFAGQATGYYNTTGNQNTFVGQGAGYNPANDIAQYRIAADTDCAFLGYGATKNNASTLTNATAIGATAMVTASIYTGAGSPNGSQVGSPGDIYLNTSGGAATTLYVKESGANTNTGWVGK